MVEEWKGAFDNAKMVGTVAVGLRKAFDSLPSGLLIDQLIACGLDIKFWKLVSSYVIF